ncbi:MAG: PSD1 and planctomycete cytochrome C domain-containing protein [Bacteroidota bacterium]
MRYYSFALLVSLSILCLCACGPTWPEPIEDALATISEPIDFNTQVRPILSDRCFACHGPDPNQREAGLRLDVPEGLVNLPESGIPLFQTANPQESSLIRHILSQDPRQQMPPPESNLSLSAKEKAILIQWVSEGATWSEHWAFKPPQAAQVPRKWQYPGGAIDYFVSQGLKAYELSPAVEADRYSLIRRLSFDLNGLPPSPAETAAFVADQSPDAYEKVVDRLLSQSAYGERWCWDWLDAARYADTNGFQGDPERTMWPWRDWVIKAFNDNMPYDQFTVEQIAGDLLPQASQDQILATAFNRNHMINGEGGRIPEETRVENVFDRVETVGTIWLGLTLTCSRCHDHKYDPITQSEYYQLFDYFNQSSEVGGITNGRIAPVLDLSDPIELEKLAEIQAFVDSLGGEIDRVERQIFPRPAGQSAAESPNTKGLLGEHVDALKQKAHKRSWYYLMLLERQFKEARPSYAQQLALLKNYMGLRNEQSRFNQQVMVMDQLDSLRETHILRRGNYSQPQAKVKSQVPDFLPALAANAPNNRLGLAQWLISDQHPLTARVTVNRYWQAFFGTGLVKTAEDFGAQGEKPSHPALLDWLAVFLMQSGWDLKALHKEIVMSHTYRQASHSSPELQQLDPDNRLLARGARFRLPSWMIRDQALQVSGLLVPQMGGPAVYPYQPAGIWAEATFGQKRYQQDHGEKLYRRTLYTFWRRIVGPPGLFDNSPRQVCSVTSFRTNSPLHALTTLNDITYIEAARLMAKRVILAHSKASDGLDLAFALATNRKPEAEEKAILLERLEKLRHQYQTQPSEAEALLNVGEMPRDTQLDPIDHAAWTALCSLLLNLDETLSKQ